MEVYTYSEARQNLAKVLDRARKAGAVRIQRRGGLAFQVTPVALEASPLDVGFVETNLTRDQLVAAVRESRKSR
ncbi:MAG: type II toxin-antitoxin system prevent-host-death family antitoxin [Terriglobales bacterium]|jgi:prevent-host-death family protein